MITVEYLNYRAGILRDAESVKLSNSGGTAGIIRNDTSAVIVADGTDMVRVAEGVYRFSFNEPAASLTYTAYFEILDDRDGDGAAETYRENSIFETKVSAAEMVQIILQALRDTPAGVASIAVDGTMVSYTRAQLLDELKYWQNRALAESGARPRVANILLDRGYSSF